MPGGFDQINKALSLLMLAPTSSTRRLSLSRWLVAQRAVGVGSRPASSAIRIGPEMGQHRQVARAGSTTCLASHGARLSGRHASLVGGAAHRATAVETSHGGLFLIHYKLL